MPAYDNTSLTSLFHDIFTGHEEMPNISRGEGFFHLPLSDTKPQYTWFEQTPSWFERASW